LVIFSFSEVGVDSLGEICHEKELLGSVGELETMITASIVAEISKFTSCLQFFGEIEGIGSIEIKLSSKDNGLW